eukprot:scaffold101694_cov72-Phaeocystis_antarctica.AAC.2
MSQAERAVDCWAVGVIIKRLPNTPIVCLARSPAVRVALRASALMICHALAPSGDLDRLAKRDVVLVFEPRITRCWQDMRYCCNSFAHGMAGIAESERAQLMRHSKGVQIVDHHES